MLYYLDQYASRAPFWNENYPRELFELHTMGAAAYLGVLNQDDVPADPDDPSYPIGYVDGDVYEAARCLSGWTISDSESQGGDTGLFFYEADWHDIAQKKVATRACT